MSDPKKTTLALFYCQNTPKSSEHDRQSLERKYGQSLRLFPIPCSGRIDPHHLLKALEEFADAAYLVACPDGACRYFEGNRRALKRVERTKAIISSIGLAADRVGIIVGLKENPKSLARHVEDIAQTLSELGPSPVLHRVS